MWTSGSATTTRRDHTQADIARAAPGKTPMETFRDAKHLADEKMLDRQMPLWVDVGVQASDRQEAEVAAVR